MFEKEMAFFKANQEQLVLKYAGKFLVIKNESVIGVYNSPLEAFTETSKSNPIGTFMIQPCKTGADAFSVTISTLGIIR